MKTRKVFVCGLVSLAFLFPEMSTAGCPKTVAALKSVLANKSIVGVSNEFRPDGTRKQNVGYIKFNATGLSYTTYDDFELTQIGSMGNLKNYDAATCKGEYESSELDSGRTAKGIYLFRESGTEIDIIGTVFEGGSVFAQESGTAYIQNCPASPSFLSGKRFTVTNTDMDGASLQADPSVSVGRFTSAQTYTISDPSTGRQIGQGQFTYVRATCSAGFTESAVSGGVSAPYVDEGKLYFRDNGRVIESFGSTVSGGTRTGRMSIQ